jgi:Holliday junction resolvase-like predicted endonuclease
MLTENAVVDAVAAYLEKRGWRIISKCTTMQTGIDIVAEQDHRRMLVEAKGLTSASNGSKNFGRPFYQQQKNIYVASAVMTACELRSREPGAQICLAFPEDRVYRNRVAAVQPALTKLGVSLLWVDMEGNVRSPLDDTALTPAKSSTSQ